MYWDAFQCDEIKNICFFCVYEPNAVNKSIFFSLFSEAIMKESKCRRRRCYRCTTMCSTNLQAMQENYISPHPFSIWRPAVRNIEVTVTLLRIF